MITVERATTGDRGAWDAFVAARSEADLLQLWAWGEAMAVAGQPPLRLVARDGDGAVRGLAQALVRPTAFGRPVLYAGHGPVWDRGADDGAAVLAALVDGLRSAARDHFGIVVKVDPAAARIGDDDGVAVAAAVL
ncbi:MAG: hypothetical protein ABIV26_08860, partial [Candidatus Limnocylindrales bacterium]